MPSQNLLLDSLPRVEYARLRPHLESITVARGGILTRSDQWISYVYFPTTALVALLVTMEDGAAVEAGLIGAEGMVNLPVFWGVEQVPYTAIVLHVGDVLRMRAEVFRHEVKYSDTLQRLLMLFTNLSFTCATQRTGCNRLHSTKQRVANWLLAMCDYLGRGEFNTTHEFMAGMLGVRRASVTEALNEFKRNGMLLARRGQIEIIEPQRLESLACECHQIIKGELEQFRGDRGKGALTMTSLAKTKVVTG